MLRNLIGKRFELTEANEAGHPHRFTSLTLTGETEVIRLEVELIEDDPENGEYYVIVASVEDLTDPHDESQLRPTDTNQTTPSV